MRQSRVICTSSVVFVLLVLALFVLVGGRQRAAGQERKRPHYALKDLGTFGGPNSYYFSAPVVQSVNSRGVVVGVADTIDTDPDAPNCFNDCLVNRAFVWHRGQLLDLGVLPGGFNSAGLWVNDGGMIAGFADNGIMDSLTGLPELVSVVWRHRQIVELGTLGGGFSFPNGMNTQGSVVGVAQNAVPDDFSMLGLGTEGRAYLWKGGALLDLGTLGGPDAWAASINELGQIAGWSYTDSTPNSTTGIPTQHPFLWTNGRMKDLGTLGGTMAVTASLANPGGGSINDKGQVVGTSNVAGDAMHHPFLWDNEKMIDLGTLGGDNGEAYWINSRGEVVGRADISGSSNHHAFLWRTGVMIDLGVPEGQPCSTAIDINARSQVIIDTGICGQGGGPGLLWENGVSYDLNTLISPHPGLFIADVNFINDRGEIAATGVFADGSQRDLLLVPCDEDDADSEGCNNASEDTNARTQDIRPVAFQTSTFAAGGGSASPMLHGLHSRFNRKARRLK